MEYNCAEWRRIIYVHFPEGNQIAAAAVKKKKKKKEKSGD